MYMASKSTKYVIGNWKMEPRTALEAERLFDDIQSGLKRIKNTEVVVCPPFIFTGDVQAVKRGAKLAIGAQDVFWEKSGAFTGEISIEQLQDSGVEYVLVGHSERRALGDGNKVVSKKLTVALDAGLRVVLCVGESERDSHGKYFAHIKEQIESALLHIPHTRVKNILIAYEPIWAIGVGEEAIGTHDLHEMSIYIKKVLIPIFGKKISSKVPVLYGGSVNRNNAEALIHDGEIQGFLVGRASMDAHHFGDIISFVEKS